MHNLSFEKEKETKINQKNPKKQQQQNTKLMHYLTYYFSLFYIYNVKNKSGFFSVLSGFLVSLE